MVGTHGDRYGTDRGLTDFLAGHLNQPDDFVGRKSIAVFNKLRAKSLFL